MRYFIDTVNSFFHLLGRPMRISFASQTVPSTAPSQSFGGPVRRPLRSSGGPRQSSGGRGPRGGSRRRQQNNRPKPTEADLDADMDSYMAAPVQSILKCCFFILNVNFIRRLLFRRRIQRCSRAYFIFFFASYFQQGYFVYCPILRLHFRFGNVEVILS